MASITIKFQPPAENDRKGMIYYQIVHDHRLRRILSECAVTPSEWSERDHVVIIADDNPRRQVLIRINDRIRMDLDRLTSIDRRLRRRGYGYTADDLVAEYKRQRREFSLMRFTESIVSRLRENGHYRTSEIYTVTLSNFRKFLGGFDSLCVGYGRPTDIALDYLTADIMEAYESWQVERGIVTNTSSFYLRVLRAVYNRAVDMEVVADRSPFRRVYTGVAKTIKRALPMATIKVINSLDLSMRPSLDYARDMFMLSFMLRGMSFIDMAYLKKTDLCNGHIIYRRRKTGQRLVIGWTPAMQRLRDKYPDNDSIYLLPILSCHETVANDRRAYLSACSRVNRCLKRVAEIAGIAVPLTMYVARHSWASAAQTKGIPVSVISEGMGHDSESTTRIYLAGLDTSVIDKANAVILSDL